MKQTTLAVLLVLSTAVPGFCGAIGGVPEPGTDLLLGAAVLGFGAFAVYKSRKKKA